MDDYGDPIRTVEINRAEAEWRASNRAVQREHDKNKRIIKSFCDYIRKEFKKDEGRYVKIKKIIESDEFKKLEDLIKEKKEESNESV